MSRTRMLTRRQAAEWQAEKCLGCDRLIQPKQTPKGHWFITLSCSKRCSRRARNDIIPPQACLYCGTEFVRPAGERPRKYCTKRCSEEASRSPLGYTRRRHGYLVFHTGKAEILVHRILMEGRLGRPLTDTETVHHINGQREDNRPENLELWDHAQPHGQRVSDK